jgi:cobalt-zinc-cadmium efflux system membrane fusion protein
MTYMHTSFATYLIAVCAFGISATASFNAHAGPGHDHRDEAPAATGGNSPKRQADGSVFLPKPTQRQLAVRTVVVEEKALPKTMELTGRVVADPNAGGKVQPTQAGRIEPGPRGLPQLGQAVRKGEVLAVVRASASAIEQANQVAQAAELTAALGLARQRVARLEQLEGTVAQKDIDAARADATSLAQRMAAVGASLSATEQLRAPVSGVIAFANVVAGQVVDAREVLFEIVDPARLMVEASAFDAALLGNIASASASPATGVSVPLKFVGAGRSLRDGAIPLHFSTTGNAAVALAVHQPVKVIVKTKEEIKGFAVPTAAVVKSPSNQDMVWVHTGAEVFEPRPVRFIALDGATVSVLDGLKAADRVVTQGAALLNQVR